MSNRGNDNGAMVPYGGRGRSQAQQADDQAMLPAHIVATPSPLVLYGANIEVLHITHPRVRMMMSMFAKNVRDPARPAPSLPEC